MVKMNPLRNTGQPTMMSITWPIHKAKFTSVRYYTSRSQTYAHMTARYGFCSGQSSYVKCWVQTQNTNLFSDGLPVTKQCFCYDGAVQNSHCVRATMSTSVIYYEFTESLLSNNTYFLVHVEHNPVKIPVKEPLLPIDICHAHWFLTHSTCHN